MELQEAERTVIAKPVASRPTISNFRSFSELLAGATNGSPLLEPTITAIRPKTVRFKHVTNSQPVETVSSQAQLDRTQASHLSDKIVKSNHTSPLLYKPLAKTVSRTTISLLANMGTFNTSREQALAASQSENAKGINPPKLTPMKSGNDKRSQFHTNNSDRPSYDGYNWRKYGQKQVKGSDYPRSYYKCTHPNCLVKKKVERSIDGEIAEIVYKGEHNHSKPRLPRRHAFDGTSEGSNTQLPNNQLNNDNEGSEGGTGIKIDEVLGSSSHLTNLVKVQESYNHVSSEAVDACMPTLDRFCGVARVHDESASKRRKSSSILNEPYGEGLQQPRIVVHDGTDSEAISDGFRSYYRCTGVKCNVRKHVERASDDPSVFITTYEGKHNHEMPIKKSN
ncbi:DNA-binding WRKY [Cynara cardunculus var. scolymus]|uniref:DNA-binding WRKY n=1 Tax=Cynara cardunculus var. scolymus TaxID=59895 RepID=A0A118K5R6_CYNCS|nr:DNA-binding WRKY [Cynara cardunculus var. scolymus]